MYHQTFTLASGKTGRDDYSEKYRHNLSFQSEWLKRGAIQKADSVQLLMDQNGIKPNAILELGCGTGAVIGELQKRNLAQEYFGLDFSADAIRLMSEMYPNVSSKVADITVNPNPFERNAFDIVVLSHTIEHLEEPIPFLQSVRAIPFKGLIAEVPLEDLLFGRLKSRVNDRAKNTAGHVQFFTRESFKALLTEAGFNIIDERIYSPSFDRATINFAYRDQGLLKWSYKMFTERYLPLTLGPLWYNLYHAHYAVLCEKR